MKLKLFIAGLCTIGISVSQGMELTQEQGLQKIQPSIQHIPQDITIGIFHCVNYPTLARSRQVCKLWKCLIDEKLPLPQRYILKYLGQFVQKNNPDRTIKRFEGIFLGPLSDRSGEKTILDDIIDELQEDLSATKEQAYQALLRSQLVSVCSRITLEIDAGGQQKLRSEFAFPYIPTNLVKQDREPLIDQDIRLVITGEQDSSQQIFGIGNLPAKILDRVTEVELYKMSLRQIPRQLQKLPRLAQFRLMNNQLSSIPAEIGQLTNLQELSLDHNQLINIPVEIGQLTNLQELSLDNNQLSSVSAEIGQLINLQALFLHNNQLSSVPAEIGQLTNLQHLSLHNNQLSSIPAEIGQLINLEQLYLNNNQLSSIPAEIGQLTHLEQLSLDNNQLSSIPAEVKEALSNCTINI